MNRDTGTYVISTTLSEPVRAFVPHPLPPARPALAPDLYADLNRQAELALARLAGVSGLVPSVDWLLYSAIRKEALLTSQIEGTQATLTDLFDEEAGFKVSNTEDVKEVTNYLRAFRWVQEQLRDPNGLPISVRLLCEADRLLLDGARGADKQPGELRRSQNWIDGTRPGNAAFVPPPPEHVPALLADMERFIHDVGTELPPMVRVALIHAQFETIHPFLDGNGRIGRLLIAALFEHWGLLAEPLMYLSGYLKQHQAEYYRRLSAIYGAKPSAVLMSEFIVPMPAEERGGDEEADPIRISAHGMDFQIGTAAKGTKLGVSLTGAVYVRILPTEDEVKPGGRLEATFPLTREARADIRSRVKNALGKLVTELPGGKTHLEWAAKSYDARKVVYESMGLPFDNRLDRTPAEGDVEVEGAESESGETGEDAEVRPTQEVAVGLSTPDGLADDIPPPPKWLRLELILPSFEFTPATAEADAKKATDALNEAVAKQLADWAASSDLERGGKLWGYRRARVRPSDVRNWKGFLERVRASTLEVIVPKIDLRWVVQAMPDPVDTTRMAATHQTGIPRTAIARYQQTTKSPPTQRPSTGTFNPTRAPASGG